MNRRGSTQSAVAFGIFLIAAGSVLLADRLGIVPGGLLQHFWPMAFVLLGTALVLARPTANVGGYILILVGIYLELRTLGILRVRFWDLWPLYLILFGIHLLWRALRPPSAGCSPADLNDSRLSEWVVFGGVEGVVTSQKFEGGNLMAMFGGISLDLRNARMAASPVVLHCDAAFGGIELKVPPAWRVSVHAVPIFGGVECKALPPASEVPEQHLVIRGFVMFGGVEIKN